MQEEYRTVARAGVHETEVNRSRFLRAFAPAATEHEAQDFIAGVRKEHADATHNCYAYVIGADVAVQKASDADVWREIARSSLPYHPAYDWGNRRLSCVLCALGCNGDLVNGVRQVPTLAAAYAETEVIVQADFKNGLSMRQIIRRAAELDKEHGPAARPPAGTALPGTSARTGPRRTWPTGTACAPATDWPPDSGPGRVSRTLASHQASALGPGGYAGALEPGIPAYARARRPPGLRRAAWRVRLVTPASAAGVKTV
jgi:hypothetical protein